uniref:Uncharacterized protein n=1 Tax=Timema tahoe TaxID=61484 RepID=A0A7R9NVH2_9NEOP|nr:unnamed protein product [Timema tahoe]
MARFSFLVVLVALCVAHNVNSFSLTELMRHRDISKSQHDNEVALIFETVILWSSSLALKEQETNLDQGKRDDIR